MGSGKTTVGRELARVLGRRFIDIDQLIVEAEGKTVTDIFKQKGEPYFRQLETKILFSLAGQTEEVVALGGGTFCQPVNKAFIKENGISIWLHCSIDDVLKRVPVDGSRPLFRTPDEMIKLLEYRTLHYQEADFKVETSNLSVDQIVGCIVALLRSQMDIKTNLT
jgi:shikimate kinase